MRINHTRPRRSALDYLLYSLAFLLLAGGGYLLYTLLSPWTASLTTNPTNNATTQKLAATKEQITEDRLYIPKINVNVPYAKGDAKVLENGAWWRSPTSGNPAEGGNFVVAAHRFVMGTTPQQTQRKSPFYTIDRVKEGDTIIVDYSGKRYTYRVTTIHRVAPSAVEIEAPQPGKNIMTLYSCTLAGSADGRDVIVAEQVPSGT